MTTIAAAPSSEAAAFNVSLREPGGKSTTSAADDNRLQVASCRFPSANQQPATCNLQPETTFKIVLDAGHGGKDPGGMGKNSHEKAIALKITQLLAIGIRTNFPRVEVIMTRSDDTFIPLYERARIANEAGADLFVSVHANIMPGSSATYGTETFVMGQHVAKHNLAVAKRENAAILLEDNVRENYGYDPNSDEGHIMMSTFQHAFLERSILFADLVESQFKEAGRKSRGVKQAGFVVLKQTTMPAVLVETGFMSNPDEEAYLLSGKGQQELANAILKAFAVYYKDLVGAAGGAPLAVSPPPPTPPGAVNFTKPSPAPAGPVSARPRVDVRQREVTASTPPTAARRRQWTARGVSPTPLTYTPPRPAAPAAPVSYGAPVPTATKASPAAPRNQQFSNLLSREVTNSLRARPSVYEQARRSPAPVASQPAADSLPYRFRKARQKAEAPRPQGLDLENISDAQLLYAVQVFATKRNLDLTTPQWQRVPYPIQKLKEGEYNKYQIRGLATAAEAETARRKAKEAGIVDAMVVVYYEGKRLPPPAVRYLLAR